MLLLGIDIGTSSIKVSVVDGSVGAALGAGVGVGFFAWPAAAFAARQPLKLIEPAASTSLPSFYNAWKALLEAQLK